MSTGRCIWRYKKHIQFRALCALHGLISLHFTGIAYYKKEIASMNVTNQACRKRCGYV